MLTKRNTSSFTTVLLILASNVLSQAQAQKKLTYALFVDNSASMHSQLKIITRLAAALTQQLHDHGRVSIFDFAEGKSLSAPAIPNAEIEQSQDEGLLKETVENLYIVGGETTLFDAIHLIATRLESQAKDADKIIVLITDGADRKSTVKSKQLIQELKDLKIRVYAVGLVNELDSVEPVFGKDSHSKSVEFLRNVTTETGGRVVFPKSARTEAKDLLAELSIPNQ